MKTSENKLKKEQVYCNKVVFIYLLIVGILVISTSGKNFLSVSSDYAENNHTIQKERNSDYILTSMYSANRNEKHVYTKTCLLVPVRANLAKSFRVNLEMKKLNTRIIKNSNKAYNEMLSSLAPIEEPELFILDVISQLNNQKSVFKINKAVHFIQKQNPYLNDLYKQKNATVLNEIEQANKLNELLVSENEKELEFETWMTNDKVWQFTQAENEVFERYLADMYEQKNQAVSNEIEKQMNLKNFFNAEEEQPLLVESWMMDGISTPENEVSTNEYLANLVKIKNEEVKLMLQIQAIASYCSNIEEEEPMAIEPWMTSDRCWCPNKKPENKWYDQPFALYK